MASSSSTSASVSAAAITIGILSIVIPCICCIGCIICVIYLHKHYYRPVHPGQQYPYPHNIPPPYAAYAMGPMNDIPHTPMARSRSAHAERPLSDIERVATKKESISKEDSLAPPSYSSLSPSYPTENSEFTKPPHPSNDL